MGVEPPFIYDKPSTYTFGGPTSRAFDPKAASHASWTPRAPRPKHDGPLIDFNKHPDSYIVVPYGDLSAKPMKANTKLMVTRARQIQLFLRACALLGAIGALFCVIAITKTTTTVAWIIRVAPAVALAHALYGIHHLCRAATGRTPASTASYMVFAAVLDTGLIPFFVFSAWLAHADYTNNAYGWSTLFKESDMSYKIINAFFLLSCTAGGLFAVSLLLSIYLATKFKQIARLPPDLNPLEPTLTSRHKHKKSEAITEKNMNASELASRRDGPTTGGRRIPFIHTRTDSVDSVTLYGNESARNSRAEFRKEMDDHNKDPWYWSRTPSPVRPGSAVNPSPTSRTAGAGLETRPERWGNKDNSSASSWLSYLDYEGVPSNLSAEAKAELNHEVRPLSPVSALSGRDSPFDRPPQDGQNWYQSPTARNSQSHLLSPDGYLSPQSHHGDSVSPGPRPQRRSREPLAMHPPTPTRVPFADENGYFTPAKEARGSGEANRPVLHDADVNGQARSHADVRPSNFVGSGGKSRFYGNLRSSIGSFASRGDKKNPAVTIQEVDDLYERTRTMQTESDYSANFEVYESDSDDGKLRANIGPVDSAASGHQWNGIRQTSNSTAYDLHGSYAGLGTEFGKGMGRRREVSGKIAEEGRATPAKKTAAGWERFKGL